MNLIQSFSKGIPIPEDKIDFTIPINAKCIKKAKEIINDLNPNKKICIIKTPSDRNDWKNPARMPKVEYFQYLIDKYKDNYHFISIGNKQIELVYEELKNIDMRFEFGELDLPTIMGLVSLADMVITYNCFLFPLGIATHTKTLVINGGYSNPEMYIDFPSECICLH